MLLHCLRRPRANSAAGAFFLVFLSFCVLQESGQMEQMAQTSMLCAGHMMDPCWPLLMTLAKCTCSPSPALNQGSVMLTHSDKHKAHQSRGLRVCKFVPLPRHADFQHCQNYAAMVFVSQLHCDYVLMNTGKPNESSAEITLSRPVMCTMCASCLYCAHKPLQAVRHLFLQVFS